MSNVLVFALLNGAWRVSQKTIKIRIRHKPSAAGRKQRGPRMKYVESFDLLRPAFTDNRLALIRVIREEKPKSMAELARITRRPLRRIIDDVGILVKAGLVSVGFYWRGRAAKPNTEVTEVILRIKV